MLVCVFCLKCYHMVSVWNVTPWFLFEMLSCDFCFKCYPVFSVWNVIPLFLFEMFSWDFCLTCYPVISVWNIILWFHRLDPRPDSRYESKFRRQAEKEDESRSIKRRDGDKKRGFTDRRDSSEDRDSKEFVRNRKWEDEKREERGKGETYDLRQALERRRSDKEE